MDHPYGYHGIPEYGGEPECKWAVGVWSGYGVVLRHALFVNKRRLLLAIIFTATYNRNKDSAAQAAHAATDKGP